MKQKEDDEDHFRVDLKQKKNILRDKKTLSRQTLSTVPILSIQLKKLTAHLKNNQFAVVGIMNANRRFFLLTSASFDQIR